MRRIVWSAQARRAFREIVAYIAERNPSAAAHVASRIRQSLELLAERPIGTQGRVAGTYEKIVTKLPYVTAYALEEDADGARLVVLHIVHGARDWPDGGWPEG